MLLPVLLVCVPAAAMVNGEEPAEDDRRFDAVAAFSHAHWLGQEPEHKHASEHNWFGTATLVAPDVVLLARHLVRVPDAPEGFYAVRFRRHADGSLGSREAGPASYHHVRIKRIILAEKNDLALGILAEPVEHIQPIAMSFPEGPFEDRDIIMAGWGSEARFLGIPGPRRRLLLGRTTAKLPENPVSIRFAPVKTELREMKPHPTTGKVRSAQFVIGKTPSPNVHDSGGAVLLEDEDGGLTTIAVITTYGGGRVLAEDADARLPLAKVDPAVSGSLDDAEADDVPNDL